MYFDGVCLQPLQLPSGVRSYLFSLLAVRRFRVADVEVRIWLPGEEVSLASEYDDFIHVGLIAPQPVHIGYVPADKAPTPLPAPPRSTVTHHWQRRATMPFSTGQHCANRAVSVRMAA